MTRRTWLYLAVALLMVAALGGLGGSANAAFPTSAPATSANAGAAQKESGKEQLIDCARIQELGIDKQMNMRASAAMVRCGKSEGGSAISSAKDVAAGIASKLLGPLAYGGADVNVSAPQGEAAYPKVTQSEAFVWAHGQYVVNAYNDGHATPSCYGGYSYSTDGGATFTRPGGIAASPVCTGHGTNYGDPTVVYNQALSMWFMSYLATGCGGQGIGLWTLTDATLGTPVAGACAHNGSQDDRQSMWVDNNVSSPYYGRMYISWNNFGAGQVIQVIYSDNGTTWSAPVNLTTGFERNIQLTGDSQGSGRVYVAGMNEGGGGLAQRTNIMHRSTDGGVTWPAGITMGASFPGPGRAISGYFALVFSGIWRHMGWGQPGAAGSNVHYVWSQCGGAGPCSGSPDHGDIYYQRSTDTGTTWEPPVKMNTDTGTAMQWQPSLAVTTGGAVYAGWYDQREVSAGADLNCPVGSPTIQCYRRWGRVSLNNGSTFLADDMVGDVTSPLPAQPDGSIQTTYEGDYNYISCDGTNCYDHWTDGRVIINNTSQQDVFQDKIPLVQGTPTPTTTGTQPTATATRTRTITPTITPTACGSSANYTIATAAGTIVPGTTDIGNHCDDCVTSITLPFPVTIYGQTYTTASADSNGKIHFPTEATAAYTNECLPSTTSAVTTIFPYWDDLYTLNSGYGIYTSISGTAPNRIFNIEWRAQYFPGSGSANFELRLYETSGVQEFDIVYGTLTNGNTSATGGVQNAGGTRFTQDFCNGAGGQATGVKIYTLPPCSTGTPSTATRTATAGGGTATPTQCAGGGPIIVNGAITTTDPTQTGRLFRDGVADTCAAPGTCGTPIGGTYHYDAYTYTNTTGASACVNVNVNTACTGTNFIYVGAYLGTFDPNNICTNFAASLGSSPNGTPLDFSFTVPAGASYTVVVAEVTANGGCAAYTLTITGGGGGGCSTPTAGTAVPTASPTCSAGGPGTWTAGPNHPASPGIVRAVGVFFPTNGKFYTIGGRTSDAVGSDTTNPYEFTPGTPGTWATKAGVLPDNQVNNMACGVLTDAGTPYIYCVGGSAAGATTATNRVFRYNPVTDVVSPVAAPWPGNTGGDTLPGGFAVVNNKLYIIGGFQINVAMTNQTWEFTPTTNTWVQKTNYPVARGYVPAAAIGTMIYTGGGSDYQAGAVVDTADSYKFDTAANTWTAIPNIPRATGETRAVTMNGTMWVLGGGRVAPNPSNEVDVFNPGTNAWTIGTPFLTPRRNFPADSNGTTTVWLAGGYAPTTPTNTMEIFQGGAGNCPTGTPATATRTATTGATSTSTVPPIFTATGTSTTTGATSTRTNTVVPTTAVATQTRTATRVPTATACTIEFTDVPLNNPFRIYIRCLACRGIISGYSDGTFRPFNPLTRGQASKMISNSAGFNETPTGQFYTDVPTTNPFYVWIYRVTLHNVATGYNDPVNCAGVGSPCFRWNWDVTRGQLAKMASQAAGFNEPIPAGIQSFTDVPPTETFYKYIERLSRRGIISGYQCGIAPAGPCDPLRRPYYLPNTNITRGQAAKIVANTFFPDCQQPGPQTTPPARPQSGAVNQ